MFCLWGSLEIPNGSFERQNVAIARLGLHLPNFLRDLFKLIWPFAMRRLLQSERGPNGHEQLQPSPASKGRG